MPKRILLERVIILNKRISSIEIFCICYFLIRSSFFNLTLNSILKSSKNNSISVLIISSLLGLIPLFIYITILKKIKNNSLKNYIDNNFTKLPAKTINYIIFISSIFFLILLFSNYTLYIKNEYLEDMSPILISLSIMIPFVYISLKKITVLTRTSVILFFISVLFTLISFISLIFKVDFSNILPLAVYNTNISKNILLYIGFNILPLFFLLTLPINYNKQNIKIIVSSYITTNFLLIFIILLNVLISNFSNSSTTNIFKEVSIIGYSGNIEALLSIQTIFDLFIIISTTLFFIRKYLNTKDFYIIMLCIYIVSNLVIYTKITFKYTLPLLYISFLFIPFLISLKRDD